MSSDCACMGFSVDSFEDYIHLVHHAANSGELCSSPNGHYIAWSPGEGVEFWAQAMRNRQLIGGHPHFASGSRHRVRVEKVVWDRRRPMDGSLYCWACPAEDDSSSGLFPFVVDIPDFDRVRHHVRNSFVATVELAAFAREWSCFKDETAFQASEMGKVGPCCFIPSGTFYPGGRLREPPVAEAVFTAQILCAETRINPISQAPFYCLRVSTYGGDYDMVVVADPASVTEPPVVGGIVGGTFWLSGRIVSDLPEPQQPSILSRFFKRNR